MDIDYGEIILLIVYAVFVIGILLRAIRYLIDEWTGRNYYDKYPVAKAMDEMAKNSDPAYSYDNVMKSMSEIDFDKPKEQQVNQFQEQMAKAR